MPRLRILLLGAACAVAAALLMAGNQASAVPPSTCLFPASPDQFEAVAIGTKWTAIMHNQILCAINALEEEVAVLIANSQPENVCQNVSLTAAERKRYVFTLGSTAASTDPVYLGVVEGTGGLLAPDGIESVSGTSVAAWIFNRDAANTRTGRACVQVVHS